MIGPVGVHVDSKGIIDGSRRGVLLPRAGDADLLINIWEELHGLAERIILVEIEHVKVHRRKKVKKNILQFERFVAEGNEKADELAKSGAMLDERLWQKQEQKLCSRQERRCMQHYSMRPASTAWWNNGRTLKRLKPEPK